MPATASFSSLARPSLPFAFLLEALPNMSPRTQAANGNARNGPDTPATNPTKTSSESRRLRNRLSQKAFRARQAMRIKELEERVDMDPTSHVTPTAQLRDRNAVLRNQLLELSQEDHESADLDERLGRQYSPRIGP